MIHIVLISIYLFALVIRYVQFEDWNYISYATISSLPAFISGMYLAYGMHKQLSILEHIRKYRFTYTCSAIVSFFSFLYIKFIGAFGISVYILPVIYTSCIWIILSTQKKGDVPEKISSHYTRTVEHLGKISYGLYAYHIFAIVIVQNVLERSLPVTESLLALGLTICIAQLSYSYFESVFLKFK
jgi:peptidoglycan/LPS O-acetylase OafA/YrhL